jgi:hypothetical protein
MGWGRDIQTEETADGTDGEVTGFNTDLIWYYWRKRDRPRWEERARASDGQEGECVRKRERGALWIKHFPLDYAMAPSILFIQLFFRLRSPIETMNLFFCRETWPRRQLQYTGWWYNQVIHIHRMSLRSIQFHIQLKSTLNVNYFNGQWSSLVSM